MPGLDLPTGIEAGLPGLVMSTWHGIYAVAGTPVPIQERLSASIRAALREETLQKRLADLVTAPASQERATIAYHKKFLAEEVARWKPLIQAAGVYAD